MTDHPITPPPELFAEWFANSLKTLDRKVSRDDTGTTGLIAGEVAIQAARWGADQELEACVEWMGDSPVIWRGDPEEHPGSYLREARRPKPPSLKEQALTALSEADQGLNESEWQQRSDTIRRALEQLND